MKASATLNRHHRPALGAGALALTIIVSALLVGGSDAYGQTQTQGFAIFVDQKGSNTNGGKCTAGSWLKRDLNTVYASDSPAVQLDPTNSNITLDPGTYRVRVSAPATRVGTHQIRLSLIAGSASPVNTYGSSEFSKAEDPKGDTTRSFIDGVVQVSSRSQLAVQHQCQKTSDSGFGIGNAFGNPNVFTQVFIEDFGKQTFANEFAIIVDQKGVSKDGGQCTAGSWNVRTLNTFLAKYSDSISLANSQVTLMPGTYRIRASAPAHRVGVHQIRLAKIVGSDYIALTYGSSEFSKAEDQKGDTTRSFLDAVVEIRDVPTKFVIQHQCQNSKDNGFGLGNSFGGSNLFSQLYIERLSESATPSGSSTSAEARVRPPRLFPRISDRFRRRVR